MDLQCLCSLARLLRDSLAGKDWTRGHIALPSLINEVDVVDDEAFADAFSGTLGLYGRSLERSRGWMPVGGFEMVADEEEATGTAAGVLLLEEATLANDEAEGAAVAFVPTVQGSHPRLHFRSNCFELGPSLLAPFAAPDAGFTAAEVVVVGAFAGADVRDCVMGANLEGALVGGAAVVLLE